MRCGKSCYNTPYSSGDPLELFEYTIVVPTTTLLPVWAQKTLESAGSKIGIQSDTRRIRSEFSLMTKVLVTNDPSTYAQAKYKPEWENKITVEYNSLLKNKTWTLVPLPLGKNLVGCKWLNKINFTIERHIEKHKAWLVEN